MTPSHPAGLLHAARAPSGILAVEYAEVPKALCEPAHMRDKVDPGIGRTRLGQRIFECVLLIGTRSAQSIMASGFIAAQTGRTHDRTRPMLQQVRKFLPRRRRPHMRPGNDDGVRSFEGIGEDMTT